MWGPSKENKSKTECTSDHKYSIYADKPGIKRNALVREAVSIFRQLYSTEMGEMLKYKTIYFFTAFSLFQIFEYLAGFSVYLGCKTLRFKENAQSELCSKEFDLSSTQK